MKRGWRTRTRLLVTLVGTYLVMAITSGVVAWMLVTHFLEEQARQRAATVADLASYVIENPERRRELSELTGYRVIVDVNLTQEPGPGRLRVTDNTGRALEIDYHSDAFWQARSTVAWATIFVLIAGSCCFTVAAWVIARTTSRPLEDLAAAARRIGGGDWQQPVPLVGRGEVLDLANDLEQMRQRLQQLDEQHRHSERLATLGTFTATIAHEVRNPLTAVQLAVQLLQRRPDDLAPLAMIATEIKRLDLIVDGLLAFSRGISINAEACDLRALSDEIVTMLRRQAEHAGVEIELGGAPQAVVQADPARIKQVLLNLIINAIQAQHGGGVIQLDIAPDGFRVRDNGPGVDAGLREQLFDAFTTDKPEGTGLGLHIAKAIIDAHQAMLRYEDANPGAIFVVSGLTYDDTRTSRAGSIDGEDPTN